MKNFIISILEKLSIFIVEILISILIFSLIFIALKFGNATIESIF